MGDLEFWKDLVAIVGGIVGLISAIYVAWERVYKHAPLVFIDAVAFVPNGQRLPQLAIKNMAPQPIIVELPTKAPPGYFMAAKDSSSEAIVSAVVSNRVLAVIDPEQLVRFPLLQPTDYSERTSDDIIGVKVVWRFANPVFNLKDRKIERTIRKEDFEALQAPRGDRRP